MKRFFLIAMFALVMVACNSKSETPVVNQPVTVATEIVPAAATEVLPAAAPVPGLGTVATEVIADSVTK